MHNITAMAKDLLSLLSLNEFCVKTKFSVIIFLSLSSSAFVIESKKSTAPFQKLLFLSDFLCEHIFLLALLTHLIL